MSVERLFDRITLCNSLLSRYGKCSNISLPSKACGDIQLWNTRNLFILQNKNVSGKLCCSVEFLL